MSSILTNTVTTDALKVAAAGLSAAASGSSLTQIAETAGETAVAAAASSSGSTSLLSKVENIIGNAEQGVETFFNHNTALKPVAQAIVSFGESFAASHGVPVALLSIFSSGLAGILAQAPTTDVTVPKAGS